MHLRITKQMKRSLMILAMAWVALLSTYTFGQVEVRESYFFDSTKNQNLSEIQSKDFTPYFHELSQGLKKGNLWLKIEVNVNPISTKTFTQENQPTQYRQPLFLRVGTFNLDEITIYEKNVNNSFMEVAHIGSSNLTFPRLCQDDFHCYELKNSSTQPFTTFLKINTEGLMTISTNVLTQVELNNLIIQRIKKNTIMLTFACSLLLLAIIFYFFQKSSILLFYSISQLIIIFYLLLVNAYLSDWSSRSIYHINYFSAFLFNLRGWFFSLICGKVIQSFSPSQKYSKNYQIFHIGFLINSFSAPLGYVSFSIPITIFLQISVSILNLQAVLINKSVSKSEQITLVIGLMLYIILFLLGSGYAFGFFITPFYFLGWGLFDSRLNGAPIGFFIFVLVVFKTLDEHKKNISKINLAEINQLKLDLANEKLLEKENMIEMIAHEIKNPLGTIRFASNALQAKIQKSFEVMGKIHVINQSVSRINDLIDQIFLSSQLERFKDEKNKEHFDLVELLKDIISDHDIPGRIKFKTSLNQSIFSQRFLITTIFENLISNSLKYSKPNSPILITLDSCKNSNYEYKNFNTLAPSSFIKSTFTIQNFFDEQNAPDPKSLFKKYYRHANFLSKPGLGIGLSIVERSVQLLKGSVSFELTNNYLLFKVEFNS
jgi:signal transduction histidine kinase